MRFITVFGFAAGLLVALPAAGQAQEGLAYRPLNFTFGAGWTAPTSDIKDHLGNGYNINVGLKVNITPVVGIEGLYGFNGLGKKRLSIPVFPAPVDGAGVPSDFFGSSNMQFGTGNLVVQMPNGAVRPYGLVGAGVYYRPVKVTTPAIGFVPGYCDPFWYVCTPGGFVPTDRIVGKRSSTDFGMDFGGGLHVWNFFAEVRYHYIWGPEVQVPAGAVGVPSNLKANGTFWQTTFGIRF